MNDTTFHIVMIVLNLAEVLGVIGIGLGLFWLLQSQAPAGRRQVTTLVAARRTHAAAVRTADGTVHVTSAHSRARVGSTR